MIENRCNELSVRNKIPKVNRGMLRSIFKCSYQFDFEQFVCNIKRKKKKERKRRKKKKQLLKVIGYN